MVLRCSSIISDVVTFFSHKLSVNKGIVSDFTMMVNAIMLWISNYCNKTINMTGCINMCCNLDGAQDMI